MSFNLDSRRGRSGFARPSASREVRNPSEGSEADSRIALLAVIAFGAVALACGSISSVSGSGSAGTAGGGGGMGGTAGTGGAAGSAGTTGTAGVGSGGIGGGGGHDTRPDGGAITCTIGLDDCPSGFTCACGGAGVGMCTCHRNCTDATQCPTAEPMCGCPSTAGGARFCVNACFCSCQ